MSRKGFNFYRSYFDVAMELPDKDSSVYVVNYDYCTVIYYEFQKLSEYCKKILHNYFIKCRQLDDYTPA